MRSKKHINIWVGWPFRAAKVLIQPLVAQNTLFLTENGKRSCQFFIPMKIYLVWFHKDLLFYINEH